jgi:hypothetical protein
MGTYFNVFKLLFIKNLLYYGDRYPVSHHEIVYYYVSHSSHLSSASKAGRRKIAASGHFLLSP